MNKEIRENKISLILIIALVLFVGAVIYYFYAPKAEGPAFELTPGDTVQEIEIDVQSIEANLNQFEAELESDLKSAEDLLKEL